MTIATGEDVLAADVNALVPPGVILPYGAATAPSGYLLCDGSAVSRTTYADLFSVIGTTYGAGDGSTTFNLPDLKGKVPVGKDSSQSEFDTLGETGGEKTHTLTVDEMPSHKHVQHSYSDPSGSLNRNSRDTTSSGDTETGHSTSSTGGGQAHNNLQPYITLNYIIKT